MRAWLLPAADTSFLFTRRRADARIDGERGTVGTHTTDSRRKHDQRKHINVDTSTHTDHGFATKKNARRKDKKAPDRGGRTAVVQLCCAAACSRKGCERGTTTQEPIVQQRRGYQCVGPRRALGLGLGAGQQVGRSSSFRSPEQQNYPKIQEQNLRLVLREKDK